MNQTKKEGDRWCLCAARRLLAHNKGMAPKIFLKNTHIKALETIPMGLLAQYAARLNQAQTGVTGDGQIREQESIDHPG